MKNYTPKVLICKLIFVSAIYLFILCCICGIMRFRVGSFFYFYFFLIGVCV